MTDLKKNIKHLKTDINKVHDYLEHLNSHSTICNELVKESNIREASELFDHLGQLDKLIHEVQSHIIHLREHLEQELETYLELYKEPLDIDDLKHDASHTTYDLKGIHIHVEHLISHANLCQNIIRPRAEVELEKIKEHLIEIDTKAHELLEHIKEIRGEISAQYPEFLWPVPDGLDEFLKPTKLIDCANVKIKDMALKIVDTTESIQMAILNILCFSKDFIAPGSFEEYQEVKATYTLESRSGGGIAKSIFACALARAVSIPARLHFWRILKADWVDKSILNDIKQPKEDFSISSPEFYINEVWESAYNFLKTNLEIFSIYERFYELGISKPESTLTPEHWKVLPVSYLRDDGVFAEPIKFFKTTEFSPPPKEIDQRLFGGLIYLGPI